MLIFDLHTIGNKLLSIRKRMGMTQTEVAEAAGMSDRTYADIERGTVNMRTETFLRICDVLHITPDEVLTEDSASPTVLQEELWRRLNSCFHSSTVLPRPVVFTLYSAVRCSAMS